MRPTRYWTAMKALLIDGLNLIRRIDAAVPAPEDEGRHLEGLLLSLGRSVARALREHCPSHVVCVLDGEGPSWRHQLYAAYKQGRRPMPERLRTNMPLVVAGITSQGVGTLSMPCFEADDVIATMALRIASRDGHVSILSTDASFCQLLTDRIRVHDHFSGAELDEQHITRRFGVRPDQLATYFALVGNKSLNVPGVRGIGARTATRLISEHGDLGSILAAAPDQTDRIATVLSDAADDARLSKQLVGLRTDVAVGKNLRQFRYTPADRHGAPSEATHVT